MGSPETLDAGKRSNFSLTCSLLSQYLKEKGSFEELGLVLSTNSEHKGIPARTMNLLPMIENSGAPKPDLYPFHGGRAETLKKSDLSGTKSGAESAQMTIFYAGQVIVFDDLPAEKANQIMMLASTAALSPPNTVQRPAEPVASFPKFTPTLGLQERDPRIPQQLLGSDLPIKRKKSLARFLEKRKDRIVATEPYQARKPTAPSKREAWLELAPQFSSPNIQRH